MADPVLRIPIDDEAFKRYMEAFERYQTRLQDQPDMWAETNEAVLAGVAANLSLADAIGQAVSAAVRLGDTERRNEQVRKKGAQDEDTEQVRASSWRRKALDHVQELGRSASTVARSFGSFAAGGGTGGMFGMVSAIGKGMGGSIGGLVNMAGHVLNAGYEVNSAVSDKGQFARGIGTSIGQQEGFQNNLGRYTNTDQGIDSVMNGRGSPQDWASFQMLGVDRNKGSNAEVYGNVLRKQAELAKRHMDANGNIRFYETDPRGGSAFGTSHEDLNRLVRAPNLNKAIQEAVDRKSPLDRQIDAATKSATAIDTLTTTLTDKTQAAIVGLDVGLNKTIAAIDKLTKVVEKIISLLPDSWTGNSSTPAPSNDGSTSYLGGLIKVHHGDAGVPGGAIGAPEGFTTKIKTSSKTDVAAYNKIAAYLKGQGFSDAAATGAAAGAIAESHGRADAANGKSGAIGIEQLLGDRQKRFLAMVKRDGKKSNDLDEQLKFLAWELKGGDSGGKHVMDAKTTGDALQAYVYKFMRPQGRHNEHLIDAQRDVNRGQGVVMSAANVNLNVKMQTAPGTAVAVSANGAAKGG